MFVESKENVDGSIYSGNMRRASNGELLKHGKGVQIWKDGAKYEGEWINNKAQGRGVFVHPNGDLYEGEF